MKAGIRLISVLVMVLMSAACEHRTMYEMGNTHYIKVYIDEEIPNVTTGFYDGKYIRPEYKRPDVMRIGLFDRSSGDLVAERYLRRQGDDGLGHWYDGYVIAPSGNYTMIAYSFATESSFVKNEHNAYEAQATTNLIEAYLKSSLVSRADGNDNTPIRYAPDDIFVASCGDIRVPYTRYLDTLRTDAGQPYFRAESIVEHYFVKIKVENVQWIATAAGLMSGMAGSRWLHDGQINAGDEAELYYNMYQAENPEDDGVSVLYGTFGSFGKIPELASRLKVTFEILTSYGQKMSVETDVSSLFEKEEAKSRNWILMDGVIKIPDPPENTGGGMDPGIEDWGDVNVDIEM